MNASKITPLDLIEIYRKFNLSGARFKEEKGLHYFEKNDCIANPYGGDSFKFNYYSVNANKGFIAFEDKKKPGQIYSKGVSNEQLSEFSFSGESINVNPEIKYFVNCAIFSVQSKADKIIKYYSISRETGEIIYLPAFDGFKVKSKSHCFMVFNKKIEGAFAKDEHILYNAVINQYLAAPEYQIYSDITLEDSKALIKSIEGSNKFDFWVDATLNKIADY